MGLKHGCLALLAAGLGAVGSVLPTGFGASGASPKGGSGGHGGVGAASAPVAPGAGGSPQGHSPLQGGLEEGQGWVAQAGLACPAEQQAADGNVAL